MSLINIGKEYSDEVRGDISLEKVTPQIGSKLTYTNATNPNTVYGPTTTWINSDNYDIEILEITYYCHDWIRIA
jgi:hypothetical protein